MNASYSEQISTKINTVLGFKTQDSRRVTELLRETFDMEKQSFQTQIFCLQQELETARAAYSEKLRLDIELSNREAEVQ